MSLKKIDNNVLQEMMAAGKSQRYAARFFGCSDAAVSKIVKRWEAAEPPESFKALTTKQQKFVLAKLKGKSNTAAAMESHDCGSPGSAKTMGQRLNADPDINLAYHDLLYQVGIGKRRRAERLRDVVEAKDLSIASRGIEIASKLCGDFQERIDVSVSYDPAAGRARLVELRAMLAEALALPDPDVIDIHTTT